ncbi:MAG: hypothetical protein HY909_18995 [Deltaproteobacteria bacterium]|nr:hypothetical protein [Deltaproteobacteria bacterium]
MATANNRTPMPDLSRRFLSACVRHARSPNHPVLSDAAILRHVTLLGLMAGRGAIAGYRDRPERRADVLREVMGFQARKTAMKFPPHIAGAMLQTALDEGDIEATQILDAVGDDLADWGTHLWHLLEGTRWYERDTPEHRALLARVLGEVLALRLLDGPGGRDTASTLVEMVGLRSLVSDAIPLELRERIVMASLSAARGNQRWSEVELLEVLTLEELCRWAPMGSLVKVLHAVARRFGWMEEPPAERVSAAPPEPQKPVVDSGEPYQAVSSSPPPSTPLGQVEPEIAVSSAPSAMPPPPLDSAQGAVAPRQVSGSPRSGVNVALNRLSSPPSYPGRGGPRRSE